MSREGTQESFQPRKIAIGGAGKGMLIMALRPHRGIRNVAAIALCPRDNNFSAPLEKEIGN